MVRQPAPGRASGPPGHRLAIRAGRGDPRRVPAAGRDRRRAGDGLRPLDGQRVPKPAIHYARCTIWPCPPRDALLRSERDGGAHRSPHVARVSHRIVQVPARDELAVRGRAAPADHTHGVYGSAAALGSRWGLVRGRRIGTGGSHSRPRTLARPSRPGRRDRQRADALPFVRRPRLSHPGAHLRRRGAASLSRAPDRRLGARQHWSGGR